MKWAAALLAAAGLAATAGCAGVEAGPSAAMVLGVADPADQAFAAAWVPDKRGHCPDLAGSMLSNAQTAAYGQAMERALAARGVQTALVFHQSGVSRVLMPANVRYGHGGVWVRQADGPGGRPRYLTYNLLAGHGTTACNRSDLVAWSAEDFSKNLTALDSAVIVPTLALQAKIAALLTTPVYARLHNPAFSMAANPLDGRFQNCAALLMRVIVAADRGLDDPAQVDAVIRQTFSPSRVRLVWPERLAGPLLSSRFASDDQDWTLATASYESIDAYMKAGGLSRETFVFYFDPRTPFAARAARRPEIAP